MSGNRRMHSNTDWLGCIAPILVVLALLALGVMVAVATS